VKLLKARKKWKCENCGGIIQKGEIYQLESYRIPRYNESFEQIGIEYIKFRYHNRKCTNFVTHSNNPKMMIKNCWKGNHKYIYNSNPDAIDMNEYCGWCGEKKELV